MLGIRRNAIPPEIRELIAQYAAEFEAIRSEEQPRLNRIRDYRAEMLGSRTSRYPREMRGDYGHKMMKDDELERHRPYLPFGQALTVKHAHRIAGRMPDATVDRRDESPEERHRSATMEKAVWGIHQASNGRVQLADAAWDGSQTGAAVFDLFWDSARQMPIYRAIDPGGVLCVRGVKDPHAYNVVYRFWHVPVRSAKAEYGDTPFREYSSFSEFIEKDHRQGTMDMVTLVEREDPFKKCRFALGGQVPLWEEDNIGFVTTTIIPNLGPMRHIWGWADYEFVRDVCHYIPELFGQQADIIRATAGGAYHVRGSAQDPNFILRILRKGGLIPDKREAEIEPVAGPTPPDFLPEHMEKTLQYLKMLGFAPDAAWGDGSAGSGSDRGLQLGPLLELTSMKQINWADGLQRLFEKAFRMIEAKQVSAANYRGTVVGNGSLSRTRFAMTLMPGATEILENEAAEDPMNAVTQVPMSPAELFDGDYTVNFTWQNRIDPDDPAFVMSEVNKFQQGVQSLETTLERLGYKDVEQEIKRIEKEAELFPWLRQGTIALLKAQLQAVAGSAGQGAGGGNPNPFDSASAGADALSSVTDTSSLDVDAAISSFNGSGIYTGGA